MLCARCGRTKADNQYPRCQKCGAKRAVKKLSDGMLKKMDRGRKGRKAKLGMERLLKRFFGGGS